MDQIPKQAEQPKANSDLLCKLAIYLEGLKKGQGNLYPLGTEALENLWLAIKEIQAREQKERR
ncbi:MAG: hypothetical protein K0S09_41 [Sphingobacteriaceae bacterium]|jgi:hypothetical protein|nr:hypothetical protein [Sphingobacteriaceae bacterium]